MEAAIQIKNESLTIKRNEFLKLFAIITMIIDHIGAILFPQFRVFRIIGRLAFPIFCYFLVIGFHMTKDLKKYKVRMALFFFISQIPYMVAFGTFKPNIFLELLIGLQLLDAFKNKRYFEFGLIVLICLFVEIVVVNYGYGVYGIALIFLFYFFKDKKYALWGSFLILNLTFIWLNIITYTQFWSIFSLLFISNQRSVLNLNKYFYYVCYPGHLIVIAVIKILT